MLLLKKSILIKKQAQILSFSENFKENQKTLHFKAKVYLISYPKTPWYIITRQYAQKFEN